MNNYKKLVIVSGANGFTGRFVCKELLKRNIKFIALLRPGSDESWFKNKLIQVRFADLNNYEELKYNLKDCYYLLNIASIGFNSVPTIIKACKKANLKRVIFISTTAIFTKLNAKSKSIRIKAENQIRKSKLNWTIIRPTMIYGDINDRNIIKLITWLDKYFIIPIFGSGEYLQQPVNVKDVAWAVVEIINLKESFFQCINISGKNPITYNKMIDIILKRLNKKCFKLYFPSKPFILFFTIFEALKIKLPIKAEQLKRLNENKSFSNKKALKIFKYQPLDFENGVCAEISFYKNKSLVNHSKLKSNQ